MTTINLAANPNSYHDMHLQTNSDPQNLSVSSSPGNLCAHFLPFVPDLLILVPSENVALFHSTGTWNFITLLDNTFKELWLALTLQVELWKMQ